MMVSLLLLGTINLQNTNCPSNITNCDLESQSDITMVVKQYVSLIALLFYVGAYAFGFGPVTWLVLSEIFPPSIKGRAMSVAVSINWATNIFISSTFLQFMNAVSVAGTFYSYMGICIISIIFVFLCIPETKAKSLHQINKELSRNSLSKRAFNTLQSFPGCKNLTICRRWFGKYRIVNDNVQDVNASTTAIL